MNGGSILGVVLAVAVGGAGAVGIERAWNGGQRAAPPVAMQLQAGARATVAPLDQARVTELNRTLYNASSARYRQRTEVNIRVCAKQHVKRPLDPFIHELMSDAAVLATRMTSNSEGLSRADMQAIILPMAKKVEQRIGGMPRERAMRIASELQSAQLSLHDVMVCAFQRNVA